MVTRTPHARFFPRRLAVALTALTLAAISACSPAKMCIRDRLYVQPIFAVRAGTTSSYPVLTYIAARFGQHVGIGTTLQEALDQVFAGDAGASTGELPAGTPTTPTGPTAPTTPTTPTTPTGQVDQAAANAALDAASEAMTAADAALKNGDLATYQAKVNEAKAQIAKALQAMGR